MSRYERISKAKDNVFCKLRRKVDKGFIGRPVINLKDMVACVTEKECYAVLEISGGSDIETVKKAYRRLAFALHPDLNPSLPNAARRFQQVNEAYVILVQHHEEKSFKQRNTQKTQGQGAQSKREQGAQKKQAESTERMKREAEKAYAKAQKEQEKAKQAAKKASSAASTASNASNNATSSASKSSQGESNNSTFQGHQKYNEEDKGQVITDILNDPFAKRVFEDIYKRIQDVAHDKILRPAAEVVLGNREKPKDGPSNGTLLTRLKGWALRQIDDEQVLHLPRERIVPGARVRMQIQHGITSEAQTIEVTLPLEFSPGKTMRLKGLGKRVGALSGDLYIRIEPN